MSRHALTLAVVLTLMVGSAHPVGLQAQETGEVIPHAQDRPPNPPRAPEEARAAMRVPPGFRVELVAAEPDLVNPVAMTFDEKGRIWVTESLEYPRKEPGPGRDRVKVIEDTDGDGRADHFQTFADGLNIPSGIAVGHGGVWVANSPDILFYPDADRDARPDGPPTVVATGFGRADTHELPNSLTWGPDGWLYGWNGVFNPSRVISNNGRTYEFTCAVFRIHPRTREFQVWCEGTSNPWGLAINDQGDLFASACVIDHLWHLTESAYYIRQGGPYPPFTWPMPSIVDHKHQKAAYCGITYYDSDAYPAEYQGKLFMGNIHGNCVNMDAIRPQGSTYRGEACPDFLSADDAWFMPVSQKTGPDGSLYVLDWYDRYHCYQDANRDPAGIDRLKGRLYRVRYGETTRRWDFDLGAETSPKLVALLSSLNGFERETARRLLTERLAANRDDAVVASLAAQALSTAPEQRAARLGAAWVLISANQLDSKVLKGLLSHPDPTFRAWAVRAAADQPTKAPELSQFIERAANDPAPAVRLQATIAWGKWLREQADQDVPENQVSTLLKAMMHQATEPDPLLLHVCWQNLHPLLDDNRGLHDLARVVEKLTAEELGAISPLVPRLVERVLAAENLDPAQVGQLLVAFCSNSSQVGPMIDALLRSISEERLTPKRLAQLRGSELGRFVSSRIARKPAENDSRAKYLELAASWGDEEGLRAIRERAQDRSLPEAERLAAIRIMLDHVDDKSAETLAAVAAELADPESSSVDFRGQLIQALGRRTDPGVAPAVLAAFPRFEASLKAQGVELLTQRPAWSLALIDAIQNGSVPREALNVTQLRRLQQSHDETLAARLKQIYGTVREGRDPRREQVVGRMRKQLLASPGDPFAGKAVFAKLCAQCHKLYDQGAEVGPDITLNGRNDFEQLLSNVFDPNLVIGPGYQATTVATEDGRVLSGLVVEESDERLVLRIQGGETTEIPKSQLEERVTSNVSLMPEEVESQLSPQELADLFSYLCLDKPPEDPSARRLPGSPTPKSP